MNQIEIARQIFLASQIAAHEFPDAKKVQVPGLFDKHLPDVDYKKGEIVRYESGLFKLYRVNQDHTSQAGWLPDQTPALYSPIAYAADGNKIWIQPTGAHDAYEKDELVWHKDQLYQSQVAGNTWEPGTDESLWREVTI